MCNISSITSANHTPEKKKCACAHLKFFKSKHLCLFFLERDELSMNFGKTLDRLHLFVQESSGFSFSKLFWCDVSSDELTSVLIWGRIIKLWASRTSDLKFARMQISNFTHSAVPQCCAPFTMIKWTLCNRHFWPLVACPWGGHLSKPQEVDKLWRDKSFSGLPFPFHKR